MSARPPTSIRLRIGMLAGATSGRIVILTATIVVLWMGGAVIGTLIGAYPSFNEAVWDSILHMIDPGALGDDENTKQRVLGALLAITGLIILAGAALTLFEELVDRALGRIGSADPPVSVAGHLLVIGQNETLPAIVERVAAERPAGPTATVILVPPGDSTARQKLRQTLSAAAGGGEVLVVGGDLHDDGLARVCAAEAAGIVVLADEIENRDAADLHVLGTGVALATNLPSQQRPPVSLQMHRGRNVDVVWDQFSEDFDALVEDRVTAATLSLCLAHPVFSEQFLGLESRASLVFLDDLEGTPFGSAMDRHPELLPVALTRGDGALIKPQFAPDPERVVAAGERVLALADPAQARRSVVASPDQGHQPNAAASFDRAQRPQRLLIIGWSDAAESLVSELLDPSAVAQLTVFDETRPYALPEQIGSLRPEFVCGRPDDRSKLAQVLETGNPNRILVASIRETDARVAFVALRLELLLRTASDHDSKGSRPAIVAQQSSADRARQLRLGLEHAHVISSAELVGQTVAYSATSPETLAVWEQMADGRAGWIDRLKVTSTGDAADKATFASVYRQLLSQGAAPIALAHGGLQIDGRLSADTVITPGDELLVVRRAT